MDIAWGIAQACFDAAPICFYLVKMIELKISKNLTRDMEGIIYRCDVTDDDQIKHMFDNIKRCRCITWISTRSLAKKEELEGAYYNTSRNGYLLAQNISAYSLVAVTRYAKPLMSDDGGSIVTLTYLGGERAI